HRQTALPDLRYEALTQRRRKLGDLGHDYRSGPFVGWGDPLDGDRAFGHERRDGPDGSQSRQEDRSGHAECQRDLDERRPLVVLDDDAADVPLVDQFLDLRQELFAFHAQVLEGRVPGGAGVAVGRLLGHGLLPSVRAPQPIPVGRQWTVVAAGVSLAWTRGERGRGMQRTRLARPLGVALTALTIVASPVASAQDLDPGGTFIDDDGNLHEGNIEAIAAEGVTRGCNPPDNTWFCPGEAVTRGQMAAFLTRALDLEPASDDRVADDEESIFEEDINTLAAAGITRGGNPPDNDGFCPGDFVTRGQMAAFLVRAFGYTDPGRGNLFQDDDNSIFEDDIDRLGTAGVTKGCNPPDNDWFCPSALVMRDQMASFLSRALDLTE